MFPDRQEMKGWLKRVLLAALIVLGASTTTSWLPAAAMKVTEELSESLQLLFESGVNSQKQGQLENAEKVFLQVLEQGGKVAIVYNNLGAIYQQKRQHMKALAQFQEAIRLQPEFAAPRILAGASLLALNRGTEAVQQLEQAVKLQPQESIAHVQLARAFEQTNNLPGLVEQYLWLRENNPSDPEYAYWLGKTAMQLSGWCSQEIERLKPGSARLFQVIANSYVYQGKRDKAIEALNKAVQADPQLAELHLALAQLYLEEGQPATARQEIEKELLIVPNSLAALTLREKLQTKPIEKRP